MGLADPTEEINITNIRNNLKVQLSKEILNNAKTLQQELIIKNLVLLTKQ